MPLIQALVNFTVCIYFMWAWGDNTDKKTIADGNIEVTPGAHMVGPTRRRYAKPKSLRQREVASRVER